MFCEILLLLNEFIIQMLVTIACENSKFVEETLGKL